MLMTLMLSQGIPILIGGDENARSQRGNSNAYCEDNEISWFEWDHPDVELRLFTTRLVELRRRHPVFRRRRYVQGRPVHGDGLGDIVWFRPDGAEMTDDDWQSGFAKSMAFFLNGSSVASPGRRGEPVVDDSFLFVFNAHHEDLKFTVSGEPVGRAWIGVLDTADPLAGGELSAVAPTCSHRSARSSSSGESELGALARTCTGGDFG